MESIWRLNRYTSNYFGILLPIMLFKCVTLSSGVQVLWTLVLHTLVSHTKVMSSTSSNPQDLKMILKKEYDKFLKQKTYIAKIPDRSKIHIWHITMMGPKGTPFEGGYYHFQLNLETYPQNPPEVMILNPNGSFEINARMCIETVSNYTPSAWTGGELVTLMAYLQLALTDPD